MLKKLRKLKLLISTLPQLCLLRVFYYYGFERHFIMINNCLMSCCSLANYNRTNYRRWFICRVFVQKSLGDKTRWDWPDVHILFNAVNSTVLVGLVPTIPQRRIFPCLIALINFEKLLAITSNFKDLEGQLV